jgi:hypothetical protein
LLAAICDLQAPEPVEKEGQSSEISVQGCMNALLLTAVAAPVTSLTWRTPDDAKDVSGLLVESVQPTQHLRRQFEVNREDVEYLRADFVAVEHEGMDLWLMIDDDLRQAAGRDKMFFEAC